MKHTDFLDAITIGIDKELPVASRHLSMSQELVDHVVFDLYWNLSNEFGRDLETEMKDALE